MALEKTAKVTIIVLREQVHEDPPPGGVDAHGQAIGKVPDMVDTILFDVSAETCPIFSSGVASQARPGSFSSASRIITRSSARGTAGGRRNRESGSPMASYSSR